MDGVRIGHFTNEKGKTGVSVFLFIHPATGAYLISGSAPATHELVVLDPDNSVPHVHGLVFTGGSAYGLYAAKGVLDFLTEQRIGHPVKHGIVPIVPAAAIYDLAYQYPAFPSSEDAYSACISANEWDKKTGRIGAGTGATVGKLIPYAKSMNGGIGRATRCLDNGVEVMAYAVVNCVGDVRNIDGKIIAGACDKLGNFINCEHYLLSGQGEQNLFDSHNTTLVAVLTNANFSKPELKRIAKMATAGIGRAIAPIFTRFDGDILFCISCGEYSASELTIGTMAADAVRSAILNAVMNGEIIE